MTLTTPSEAVPAAARTLVGASVKLLVQVDEAAEQVGTLKERLRVRAVGSLAPTLPRLPLPRLRIDEP